VGTGRLDSRPALSGRGRVLMERKAAIVRFWFVALGVALLGLWEPVMWFGVVPLFFFPGCVCCGQDCGNSCSSGSGPAEVVLTVASVANGSCAFCNDFNGTFVGTFFDELNGGIAVCRYRSFGVGITCGANTFNLLEVAVGTNPGGVGVGAVRVLVLWIGGGATPGAERWSNSYGAPPLDCTTLWPANCPNGTVGVEKCDFSAAVVTVDV
jgi:hypothetical protein